MPYRSCVELDRLFDLAFGGVIDPPVQAHLRLCSNCRRQKMMMGKMFESADVVVRVPEWLMASTTDRLRRTRLAPIDGRACPTP